MKKVVLGMVILATTLMSVDFEVQKGVRQYKDGINIPESQFSNTNAVSKKRMFH